MGLTFKQAPLVVRGTRPTSTAMVGLADAHNTRMLSGVADWVWRICYYVQGLWRQVRNPSENGLVFPGQLEFLQSYTHVEPEDGYVWPLTEKWTAEGANPANPMMAMVKGLPNDSVVSEPARYLDVPLLGALPATPENIWNLGALQRGAIDLGAGVQASPVATVAETHQRIIQPAWSPHGKAYGGYLPTPEKIETGAIEQYECGDTEDDGAFIINYRYKFSALRSDVDVPTPHYGTQTTVGGKAVISFAGSCPCGTTFSAVNHVQGIWAGPQSYWVAIRQASCNDPFHLVRFPRTDWILGPFDGFGELAHTDGEHLSRTVSNYAADFRGTPAQRTPDTFKIRSIAFPFEEFLGRQYLLAPARGTYSADPTPTIIAEYPEGGWSAVGSVFPGIPAPWDAGGTSYTVHAGFVVAGILVVADKLTNDVSMVVKDGSETVGQVSLVPDEGDASAVIYFDQPATGSVTVELVNPAEFSASDGSLRFEVAELQSKKPAYWDAMLINRIATAQSGQFTEGRGTDTDNAAEIGANYFSYGCALGGQPSEDDDSAVNTNPMLDIMRRITNQSVRCLGREHFIAYEVAGGKSILYLQRYKYVSGVKLDVLKGIAPDGDGDGIVTVAPDKGWTNEWCAFVEPKMYHPSNSSIWKADAYTDYWSFCERCHVRSGSLPRRLTRHFAYNYRISVHEETGAMGRGNPRAQAELFAPEAPTGYRYIEGSNQSVYVSGDDAVRFRKSCRVYEPPLNIESVTMHDAEAGIAKVVFSGRFHHHDDAPATWSMTPPTWTEEDPKPQIVVDLEHETSDTTDGYRTIDNSLRCYHVHQANGFWHPPLADKGDYGQDSGLPAEPGSTRPYGASYPTFWMVKLISKPREDGNDTVEPHDTRRTVDELVRCEMYQRAGVHGWMDEAVSLHRVCDLNPAGGTYFNEGHLYDYTWESLNFEAHGGAWVGSVGASLRPENPQGFGPLPNTRPYIEPFNRLAANVNLFTKARLPVLSELQYRLTTYASTYQPRTFTQGTGCRYLDNAIGPTADTFVSDGGWLTVAATGPYSIPGFTVRHWTNCNSTPQDGLITGRYQIDTRIRPQDGWEHCLPPDLRDHVESNNGAGFIARRTEYRTEYDRIDNLCDFDFHESYNEISCGVFRTGAYSALPLQASDFMITGLGNVGGYERSDLYSLMLTESMFVEIPTTS